MITPSFNASEIAPRRRRLKGSCLRSGEEVKHLSRDGTAGTGQRDTARAQGAGKAVRSLGLCPSSSMGFCRAIGKQQAAAHGAPHLDADWPGASQGARAGSDGCGATRVGESRRWLRVIFLFSLTPAGTQKLRSHQMDRSNK